MPRPRANKAGLGPTGFSQTHGEFRAQAFWITSPITSSLLEATPPTVDFQNGGGASPTTRENRAEDPAQDSGEDAGLTAILSAIAEDVMGRCDAACASISAGFSANIAHAYKTMPREQAKAVAAAFRRARAAALKDARGAARAEVQGRQETARILYRRSKIRRVPPSRPKPR
jgi:hypothetical protein